MEKELIFHILGIKETKDETIIKAAYLAHLNKVNPEDDQEGFKRLRNAYETAVALAKQTEEEDQKKDEVDLWIDRIDLIYQNIENRCQMKYWEALLSDSVNRDLETSLEACRKLLIYLSEHIYLPQSVWLLLDKEFCILENSAELCRQFSRDFLDFIKNHIENESFLKYEMFQKKAVSNENIYADAYIDEYLNIKMMLDHDNMEGIQNKFDELRSYGLYHPYEDVEQIRVYLAFGQKEAAEELADKLLKEYPDNSYILLYSGNVKWEQSKEEEAFILWQKILEQCPQSYLARVQTANYYLLKKEYQKAKDLAMDLLDYQNNEEEAVRLMRAANEGLIKEYTKQSLEESLRGETVLKLGWCLFQNEEYADAISLLEHFIPEKEQEYDFNNLFGRVLFSNQEYEKALPYLEQWLTILKDIKEDDAPEVWKRRQRLGLAYYMTGYCYETLKNYDKAVENVEQSIVATEKKYERLSYMSYLAQICLKNNDDKKVIDISDTILSEDEDYYPAYLHRQEACFNLKRNQQVVDDYYKATELFPEYYKPYLLAQKVFYFYGQYEDAKRVLERAGENKVEFSDQMYLYKVKILRNIADCEEDRKKALEICEKLQENGRKENTDLEDISEVEYEMALLYWDLDEIEEAISHIKCAMEENKEKAVYTMILGDIYRSDDNFQDALQAYQLGYDYYKNNPRLYYCRGCCYEGLSRKEEAVEQFKLTINLDADYEDVNLRLANYYKYAFQKHELQEDIEKAIMYMDKQISLTENCYCLVHRGRMHMNAMDLDLAIGDYEKALEYVPDDWAAHNNIGYSCKIKGETQRAIEMLEKAAKFMLQQKDKNLLPYSNMADCYEIQGNYKKAIECYQKDLDLFPEEYQFWAEIGDLYLYMGDYQESLKAYSKTRKDPDYEDAQYLESIAKVYFQMGMKEKAILSYMNAIREDLKDQADWWNELGYAYMIQIGDNNKALRCLKKALQRAEIEDSSCIQRYEDSLAEYYFWTGEIEQSRKYAKRALVHYMEEHESEESYISYKMYAPSRCGILGRLHMYMGETDKAMEYFERMREGYRCKSCRFRECYESYMYRGMCYEGVGRLEAALLEYKKAQSINPHSVQVNAAIKKIEKLCAGEYSNRKN